MSLSLEDIDAMLRLMKEILHQLRCIYKKFCISEEIFRYQLVQDFFHQQCESLRLYGTSMRLQIMCNLACTACTGLS